MITTATISLRIPSQLRAESGGASELQLEAAHEAAPAGVTVRAALGQLERRLPAVHRRVCDETGAVRRHINLFVNQSHVRDREGLETPLVPGDVLWIVPAVSGG